MLVRLGNQTFKLAVDYASRTVLHKLKVGQKLVLNAVRTH